MNYYGLIAIDFKSINIVDFDNLEMYMLTGILKKFLNVFELYYGSFEV